MKNLYYLLICMALTACHSKPQENASPFDLAGLTLTEDLPELMAAQAVKPEPKDSTDDTMLGFEVFRSNSPKVLRFKNVDFSGNKNHVLFHYSETAQSLAGYALTLYSQAQTDTLIGLLGKVAKPVFKQTHLPRGSIALDVNGEEEKPENLVRKTYRVWENKNTGLTYFLSENNVEPNLTTELIVLNRSTQFGKDWIASLQLNWYKNEQSEPL